MQTEQDNVPALRFSEFDGEWVQTYLDEVTTRKSGHTPDKSKPGYWNGKIKWVSLADSNKLDKIHIKSTAKEISMLGIANSSAVLLPKGTVVISRDAGVGKSAIIASEMAVSQHFVAWICNGRDQMHNYFLYYWLQIRKGFFERQAVGSTIKTIGLPLFKKLQLELPSLPEQQKIASFLTSVDRKIMQLEEKKGLLAQYKKGMMQKLFSQNLRFKDAQGNDFPDWEEKRFGEVLKIGSGRDYKHLNVGKIPVYGTGGYMTSVDEYLYDGESVCIGRKGTIDKPVYLTGKFWTVDTLFYTHSFKSSLPKFIYAIFQTINWKKHNEASGVPSLSKSTVEKIKLAFPSLPEQQKIADFVSAIDQKIDLIATELDQAKTFKKGLLQQMFV